MKTFLKKLKNNWLDYLIVFISVGAICFVYLFTAFYQPKENKQNLNKENIIRVLSDKKQRNSEYWEEETYYINLLNYTSINTNENGYINNNGNFVSSSVLTLSKGIPVYPNTYYVFDSDTHQVCYLIYYDLYGNFISSQTKQGVFLTPDNVSLVRLAIFTNQLSSARLYIGNHVYQEYTPPLEDIFDELDDYYSDMGYNNGLKYGQEIGYNKGYNESKNYYNDLIIPEIKEEYEEIGYNNGLEYGQEIGYNKGYNAGIIAGSNNFNVLNLIRSLFDLIWGVLSVEMLPNIKLIYIVAIPLVLSVIRFILGWFR